MTTDIVFDFFGTLADFDRDRRFCHVQRALQGFLTDIGVVLSADVFADKLTDVFAELEARALETMCEYHMLDVADLFLARAGCSKPTEDTRSCFVDLFMADWNRLTYYDPAVTPLLADLSAAYRLSVLSNTHHPPTVPMHVRAMGAEPYVAQIVTSVEFGRRKPHPSIFRHALERLGVGPEQAVYVGDDYEADYLGATGAGMRCILIDPERRHTELGRDRVDALPRVAERL